MNATIYLIAHLPRNAHARLSDAPEDQERIGSAKTLAGVRLLVKRAQRLYTDYTETHGNAAARSLVIVVSHGDTSVSFDRNEEPEWIWLYATDPAEWRRRVDAIRQARSEQEAREDAVMARSLPE